MCVGFTTVQKSMNLPVQRASNHIHHSVFKDIVLNLHKNNTVLNTGKIKPV